MLLFTKWAQLWVPSMLNFYSLICLIILVDLKVVEVIHPVQEVEPLGYVNPGKGFPYLILNKIVFF